LLAVFAHECLNDPHARQAFLQRGRYNADRLAHRPVADGRLPAPPPRQQDHGRQNGEGQQRKRPVEHQHQDDDPDQRERAADRVDHRPGDEVLQGVAVLGHPRHQIAHAVPVVVRQVQIQILVEQPLAHAHDGVLPDPDHVEHLDAQPDHLDDGDDEEQAAV